jgi:hypothetical protein
VCVFLCTVFRLIVVLFWVMCVVCVLCLIVVPLPPVENPFADKINIYLLRFRDVGNVTKFLTKDIVLNLTCLRWKKGKGSTYRDIPLSGEKHSNLSLV